jgi:Flp pilus assembly protein TadD
VGLKDYQRAIEDFDRALELDPKYAWVYSRRGSTYLRMKDISKAKFDYIHAWELNSTHIRYALIAIWCEMCQKGPDPQMAERLEAIAATDSGDYHYEAGICRGIAKWLRGQSEESLSELEQVTTTEPDRCNVYFWEGMIYASLGRDEEALAAIEKSLELDLLPILLTPLRWFEQRRPEFYEKYAGPLLARYDLYKQG